MGIVLFRVGLEGVCANSCESDSLRRTRSFALAATSFQFQHLQLRPEGLERPTRVRRPMLYPIELRAEEQVPED